MNRTQMNDHLSKVMKQANLNPRIRTESMYIPQNKTLADMDPVWLRNNLCHAAQGDICKCRTCPAPCMIGKALERSVVGG